MSEQSQEPEVAPVVIHAEAPAGYSGDSVEPREAARGRGRLIIIVGAVAVVLVTAVAGGVSWYMQSPQYALSQLAGAAKAGDWTAVQARYDAASVAGEAATAAIDETFGIAKSPQALKGLRAQVDKIARPVLIEDVLSATQSALAAEPDFKSPLIQSVRRLAAQPLSITASSKTATVTLGDKSKPKSEKNLVLLMKKVDGKWRVVSWANAKATLKTAGGGWLAKYEESPEYALTRVAIASNDGDWDRFTKYVDLDTMVTGLVDAAISKATADFVKERGDNPFAAFGLAILQGMKPSFVGQFKDQFKTAITEKGGADKKPAGSAVFFGGPLTAAQVIGDTASASFDTTTTSGAPAKVTMMLVRTQRTWRVTGFKNPEALMGN